jgi:DNA-binding transcriptional LysR family regulator
MELRDIEYFAVVAEHRHLGRAAEALGLSTPALSKSLRRLEKSVRAKVVARTPKGVELTAAGSALLAQVRRLRLSLDDVTREIADLGAGRAGLVRIGANSRFAFDLVPAACALLLREAPRSTLKITLGEADAGVPAMLRGELDLYVAANLLAGHDDLIQVCLFEEDRYVFASARHRLAGKKEITLAELAQERWMVGPYGPQLDNLQRAFAKSGLPPPKIGAEINSMQFRRELLPSTDFLTLGPRRFFSGGAARSGLVELPVKGLSSRRSIGLCYRKDAYLSPLVWRFIEILKATAKELAVERK